MDQQAVGIDHRTRRELGLPGAGVGLFVLRAPREEVAEVAAHVKLRKRADQLGLGRGDDRLRPYIEKIPGADR